MAKRDTVRGWFSYLRTDREFIYALIVIIFLIVNIFSLGFAIAGIFAERGALFAHRDSLPQRDLAQWQRQVLLLIGVVAPDADEQAVAAAELHRDISLSRVTLLAGEITPNLVDSELLGELRFAFTQWGSISPMLNAWIEDTSTPDLARRLDLSLQLLDVTLNNAQTGLTFLGLDLNTQAEDANQRLFGLTGLLGFLALLLVLMVLATFKNQSERQFQEATAKESMRKFPDQSPFPIMRIDPENKMLYANPASKPLEQIFGVEDALVKNPQYTGWLAAAFQANGAHFGEGEVDGRQYSLISSPVVDEDAVNIYGFDVTNLVAAEQSIRKQLSQINALRTIDAAISNNDDLVTTLDVVLTQVREQQQADAACIFITRPEDTRLHAAAFQGFQWEGLRYFSLEIGEGLAGSVAKTRNLLVIPDMANGDLPIPIALANEGFRAYVGIPLEAHGEMLGVLEVMQRTPFEPDDEWLAFLHTLAGQAAIALDNIHLFEGMRASNIELRQTYDATLQGWAKALELRDKETQGHSRRVTELTMLMALEAGIPEDELENVRRGAILHDIGKMGVPDDVLLKPGKLDDAEYAIMKRHTDYAYEWLSPVRFLQPALDIPWAHHEKWDGSGYPRGLKGDGIPLPARLFAIIDVWDALRSDRPYRSAWSKEKTIAHIRESAGSHFDPYVVEIFIRLVTGGKIQ
jgi:HD-GYP domain-containing protein (c-di-GMP phosphodiesterase class II)